MSLAAFRVAIGHYLSGLQVKFSNADCA